jgi:hypothetical protein
MKKLFLILVFLVESISMVFSASDISYYQEQWVITSMTDQSGVTNGVFPYSYDNSTTLYMKHLGGKVDLQNINEHDIHSMNVSITPNEDGLYFVSSDSTKDKIPYTVEIFIRSRLVGASADKDIPFSGSIFGGSGDCKVDIVSNSGTTGANFVWLKDYRTVTIPVPLEDADGTKYKNTHVDILIAFDRDYSDELTEDYRTTFYCTYTINGTEVHTFPFTVLGTGGNEEESLVKTHSLVVTPLVLADEYPLDDSTNISEYRSIAIVEYNATYTNKRYDAPAITDALCSIVLSPTSDYTAPGVFKFINTKDSSITIPYYARITGTNSKTLFMSDVATYQDYYSNTSADLSGDEAYEYPSSNDDRRYVVVPMIVDGSDNNRDYSSTYQYKGEIQIIIPDDVILGSTGKSYRQALIDNASEGYFAAGTFKTFIYLSTITQI